MAPNNLSKKVEKYFAELNPLAGKIHDDISVISDAYAHLWHGFSADEQQDVINVTLIKPEIVLKYFSDHSSDMKKEKHITSKSDNGSDDNRSLASTNSNSMQTNFNHIYLYNGKDLNTFHQIITALKYNQDDVCGIYRDEHSEPFNSKTKSQMNLNFSTGKCDDRTNLKMSIPINDTEIKKGLDIFESCIKSSSPKTENAQDCRKSFMSKLFSGRNNTLGIGALISKGNDLNGDRLTLARADNESCAKNRRDSDSVSTKSVNYEEKNEPNDLSHLIGSDPDYDDEVKRDGTDYVSNASKYEVSSSYDFLNNW